MVADLSGPTAERGRQIRDGARLALRDARLRGEPLAVTLLVQDDRGEPTRAGRLARSLADLPEVMAVIGPADPAAGEHVIAALDRSGGIPLLVPDPLPPGVTATRPWLFSMAPDPPYLGETLAWYLVTELDAEGAATFFHVGPYGESLERGFVTELERLGGRVVARVPFADASASVAPFVERARAAPALLVASRADDGAELIRGLQDAKVRGPILVGSEPSEEMAGAGLFYPLLFDPAASPAAARFAASFRRIYGRNPDAAAALAYDAATLAHRAARAGVKDRDDFSEWLVAAGARTPHSGVAGEFFFTRDHAAVRLVAVVGAGEGSLATRRPTGSPARGQSDSRNATPAGRVGDISAPRRLKSGQPLRAAVSSP